VSTVAGREQQTLSAELGVMFAQESAVDPCTFPPAGPPVARNSVDFGDF
jgi:hypothetical protein